MVEFVLAGLPWAALLVDQQGCIKAANAPAHLLLGASPAALPGQFVADHIIDGSTQPLRELLQTAQRSGAASDMLTFSASASSGRACVAQSLDLMLEGRASSSYKNIVAHLESRQSWLVLGVHDHASRETQLLATFSAAASACLAADPGAFYEQLDQLCATLQLSGAVALLTDQGVSCSWSASWLNASLRTAVERQLGLPLAELLAQTIDALPRSDEPQAIPIVELYEPRAQTSGRRALQRTLLKLIWGQVGIVLPLIAHGQLRGILFLTGPQLQPSDATLLRPFGQLLGLGLARLLNQPSAPDRQATALLLRANQAITSATKLNEVLRTICEQTLTLTAAMTSAIVLPEPDGAHLRCIMAIGPYSDLLLGHRSPLMESISGRVFCEQRSYIIRAAQDEADIDPLIKRLMPQYSGIFLPLRIQQRVVGVLVVGHPQPDHFGEHELDLLEQFGANVSVAIENAQLHESIRRSEERYRTLFQNALEIVLTLDLEGRIIAWNRAALQFFGISPAELRGGSLNLYALLTPETAERVRAMQTQTLQGLPPAPVEIELQRLDGVPAVIEATMQLFEEYGQPGGVYIIGRDMTDRRRQQRALTDQVAQLSALHTLSTALSVSLDRDSILQRAAEAIAQANRFECIGIYLPYPCEQNLGLVAATGMDAALRALIGRAGSGSLVWQAWQTGQVQTAITSELSPLLKAGFDELNIVSHMFVPLISTSHVLGVLAIGRVGGEAFAAGDFQVLQTMAAQIAQSLENIKLYAAVEQSAARYRDLYENANDFIGTLAIDGRILSLNRAALEFFGYRADDLPQLTLADLLPSNAERSIGETLAQLQQNKMPANGLELRVLRSDGSTAIVEIRSRLVLDGNEPTAIHFIARDTTERHQLEAQVRQGEKLAALGQLVAGAAHELNNPLAVVLGTTQLLLRDPSAAHLSDDVRNIESAAQRAKHIVSQMLTFAREQEDVRGPVDVALLIERVVQSSRNRLEQGRIVVRTQVPPDIPAVWGDAYQLEQVLDNLLHNAAQALVESAQPSRQISISAAAVDARVRICVVDNGPGIAPQVLPRIFDPFFTTKEVGHGTGLGLSLVYGIVDKHGGAIYAESVVGQGATFTVELPANRKPVASAAPAVISGPTNSMILVVEDEPDVRAVVERALTQHGYTVDAVDSAETALVRAGSKRYDLVITDLRMPGMSGRELFEQMHAQQPQLNWVFITGDTMSTTSEMLLNQSGIPFLAKPFTLEELWEAVATSIIGAPKQPSAPTS
jgi:two-component system NtrC family sensor kinase